MHTSVTEIFPWNANFETGVPVIDQQHQKLVALVNKLANHLAYASDDLTLNRVLDELTDYTVYHFKAEEAIWRKHLLADAMTIAHEQEHQAFIDEIGKARGAQSVEGSEKVIEEILSFLTHWLAFHILENDMCMAKVVLAVQKGMALTEAKMQANSAMSGATRLLIETVLTMYDSLSSRTLVLMREIAQRQLAEQKLRLSNDVIDSTLEAIFITDAAGLIIAANPSFCASVDGEHDQLIGKNIRQIKPGLFDRDKSSHVWSVASESGHWTGEVMGVDAKGGTEAAWLTLSAVKDDQGNVSHYAGVLTSISHLIELQHSLESEANHDVLTGLPNRRLLGDRLAQARIRTDRSGSILAVCFLDLDGFKVVNDTLGHDAGDTLLRTVSNRISALIRGEDTVARVGGDEFVLLFEDLASEDAVVVLLNKALKRIEESVLIDGEEAKVSASIGVTLYPRDSSDPEQLLKHADQAMYGAKRGGKSRFCFWEIDASD
ncbi:MAG: bacteriohemerythrin [Mariprofundales bacterium]